MKIEVGMYCRCGLIDDTLIQINKIIDIFDQNNEKMYLLDNGCLILKKEIIKASHNIIDLIEVGDYVNGFPIEDYFCKYNEEKDIFENVGVITTECYLENSNFSWILAKDIKTILTKEQFENNCYKIGDE